MAVKKKTKKVKSTISKSKTIKAKDLPSIKFKIERVKKTYNFRKDSIEKLEKIAADNQISVGNLLSDLIDTLE